MLFQECSFFAYLLTVAILASKETSRFVVSYSHATMSGNLLDGAMGQVSEKGWNVRMLPSPSTCAKEHEGHVSVADFLGGVCRPLDPQAVKSVSILFDAHVNISEFGSTSTLTKLVAENKVSELPVLCTSVCSQRLQSSTSSSTTRAMAL